MIQCGGLILDNGKAKEQRLAGDLGSQKLGTQ